MEFFVLVIVFLISVPILLYSILSPAIKNYKISNGIMNCDTLMRTFMYKINLSEEELIQRLKVRNVTDEMEYKFDTGKMEITFYRYNYGVNYNIDIKEYNKFCIVRLELIPIIHSRSNIPIYMNSFWIKKFNAELIPYTKK